ncbi:MAG: PKD domain-containing protein, partial [Saprospiraceae bacterium]|nr:PKD domain-containing protein [Saprospiraceae bacterium]
MLNYLHLLCRSLLLCVTALLPFGVNAQIFTGELQSNVHAPALEKVLTHWEVYQLDAAQMKQVLLERNYSATLQVQLGAHDWSLSLEPSHILAAGYTLQISSDQGLQTLRSSYQPAFKGRETKQGGPVRLTIDSEFIQGSVWEGNRRYCLEPLRHFQADAERNMFVLYAESDVIPNPDAQCVILASEEADHFDLDTKKTQAVPDAGCYELEIAVASDKSMFNKYGSVAAVQNHNIGVLNDVQGDYTGNFNHDLEFVIVTQFVVTGTDPWTSSTDAEALLNSFTAWGNGGNFGTSYDNAELWTNRNFDGGTVGIAWVGGICNGSRYHCIQDFTSNANTIRQTVTHELGHNFSANHDLGANDCPPNYIMCPFVNGSSTWSPLSITKINSYMQVRINNGCLGPCGTSSPLIADFDWNPDPPCINQPVQFTDQSTGTITTRTWSFPGGTPPTSTATNPSVSWATPGVKNVTLTLGGVGGPASISKQVTVKGLPTANFTYSYDGLTYTFVSTSTGATEYTWNFGDSQISNEQDPVHTYNEAGIYTVTLIAQNECGTATKTATINTVPTANFSA